MNSFTLTNTTVYTGDIVIPDGMISVVDGLITYVGPREEAGTTPDAGDSIDLHGATVTSGFVDVQVNGGGDCLFNDEPTAEALQKIMDAHARFGTTQLLVTYISGSAEGMEDALHAVLDVRRESDNCLGIHYEGPVISQKRLGVHDPTYVRTQFPMELVHKDLCTMVTLAPEVAVPGTVTDLVRAGARVAIGHSEATFEQAREAIMEGVTGFTHLYNAMSPLTGREPGVVGACFADSTVWGGIIVDGYHCHFGSVSAAHHAKPRGKLMLVTDAMPPVGGILTSYRIGELEIGVDQGKCTTQTGVLAGSALDMASAVRNCVQKVGIPKDEAFRMASRYPAEFLGLSDRYGSISRGLQANLTICDNELHVRGTVRSGRLEMVDPA